MLNSQSPSSLSFYPLLVTDTAANLTATVAESRDNNNGYQFTVPTQREYWVHWQSPVGGGEGGGERRGNSEVH